MEVKFDIIKPNLYVVNGAFQDASEIYFALLDGDLVPASRHVDSVVRESIGQLKVRNSDIEMQHGNPTEIDRIQSVPLGQYLAEIEERVPFVSPEEAIRGEKYGHPFVPISDWNADFFGLQEVLYAHTEEDLRLTLEYQRLKSFIENFEDAVKDLEGNRPFRLDKKSTRKSMEQRLEELSSQIGEQAVAYHVENGTMPAGDNSRDHFLVARISLYPTRVDDKDKIQRVQTSLVEGLKEFSGPRLSLEAPRYMHQSKNLQENAHILVANYGDILRNPGWRNHLLQIDG